MAKSNFVCDKAFIAQEHPELDIALNHHRTHRGNVLDFESMPYLTQVYADQCRDRVIRKSTQSGATEWLINFSLVNTIKGLSFFYVLPTYGLVSRFVKNRVDRTIAKTPYYDAHRQYDPKARRWESITLKHMGEGSIAFVGSNSSAGFTEYPADVVVIDELDECDPDNLKMAWERLSASDYRWEVKVGNPSIEHFGIDGQYQNSCRFRWMIRPACRHRTVPDFFTHVAREEEPTVFRILDPEWDKGDPQDARMICAKCGKPIDRKSPGEWVAEAPSNPRHGYHFNKLFTSKVTVAELIDRLDQGTTDDAAMIRFYNGDLGLPYTAKGARIDEEMLNACVGEHGLGWRGKRIRICGIDVGAVFNVIAAEILPAERKIKVVHISEMRDLRQVMQFLRDYRINCGVVDALPELRIARLIARRKGMFACFFSPGKRDLVQGKNISVDRTAALDQVKAGLMNQLVLLPKNAATIANFYPQMGAATRVFDEKADRGRGMWLWKKTGADHYLLAFAYMLIANSILVQRGHGLS